MFGFGSSPKLNQFVLVTQPTCPPRFIPIRPKLFEILRFVSILARSLNDEESLKKLSESDLDLHQNRITWTLSISHVLYCLSRHHITSFANRSIYTVQTNFLRLFLVLRKLRCATERYINYISNIHS